MKFKRAILFGILLWVLIFFEVSLLMFGFGLDGTQTSYYIWHYILLAFISIIVAMLYFRKKVNKGFGEGLKVGVVFTIVGLILDAVITVPLFVKEYSFFLDSFLWIGLIEGIVLTGIVGAIKK